MYKNYKKYNEHKNRHIGENRRNLHNSVELLNEGNHDKSFENSDFITKNGDNYWTGIVV